MGRLLTPEERLKLRKEVGSVLGDLPEDQEGLTEEDVDEWKQYWLGKRRPAARTRDPWEDEVSPPAPAPVAKPAPVPAPKAAPASVFSPFAAAGTADDRALTRHERFRLRMQVWDLKEGPGPKRGPCPPDDPSLRISTVQAYVHRQTGNPRSAVDLGRILEA